MKNKIVLILIVRIFARIVRVIKPSSARKIHVVAARQCRRAITCIINGIATTFNPLYPILICFVNGPWTSTERCTPRISAQTCLYILCSSLHNLVLSRPMQCEQHHTAKAYRVKQFLNIIDIRILLIVC